MKENSLTSQTNTTGDGNVVGDSSTAQTIIARDGDTIQHVTQITGDVIFQLFAQAPVLSRHIHVREFMSLVSERTRGFVGRVFIFKAIDDLLKDPEFRSGYIVISGEPGIGKTYLLAQMVMQTGCVHHFNIASQNIRSTRDFLDNIGKDGTVHRNVIRNP
jgi:hypothetical protein